MRPLHKGTFALAIVGALAGGLGLSYFSTTPRAQSLAAGDVGPIQVVSVATTTAMKQRPARAAILHTARQNQNSKAQGKATSSNLPAITSTSAIQPIEITAQTTSGLSKRALPLLRETASPARAILVPVQTAQTAKPAFASIPQIAEAPLKLPVLHSTNVMPVAPPDTVVVTGRQIKPAQTIESLERGTRGNRVSISLPPSRT